MNKIKVRVKIDDMPSYVPPIKYANAVDALDAIYLAMPHRGAFRGRIYIEPVKEVK